MLIRVATADDAAVIARLNAAFNGASCPPQEIAARLEQCSHVERVYLAEIDGLVVGFACLRLFATVLYPTPYAEVSELYVEPEARRRGVGLAVLDHLEALAKKAGAEELFVMTDAENLPARKIYARRGFEEYGLQLQLELSS
jgi:ribosomal protein S18 acetylase RimI-like enzyme